MSARERNFRLRRQIEHLRANLKGAPRGTKRLVTDLEHMMDEHARAIGACHLAEQCVGMEYLPNHDSTAGSMEQARVKVALHALNSVLKPYRKRNR